MNFTGERGPDWATGPTVDPGRQHRGDELAVDLGVLGLNNTIAAFEIVMHASRLTPNHRQNWRKNDDRSELVRRPGLGNRLGTFLVVPDASCGTVVRVVDNAGHDAYRGSPTLGREISRQTFLWGAAGSTGLRRSFWIEPSRFGPGSSRSKQFRLRRSFFLPPSVKKVLRPGDGLQFVAAKQVFNTKLQWLGAGDNSHRYIDDGRAKGDGVRRRPPAQGCRTP